MILVHTALLTAVFVFGAGVIILNFGNRGIGAGLIPDLVTFLAYFNVFLTVLGLFASRAYLTTRINCACRRLRDRTLHIEGFKRTLRTVYLVRAAIMKLPALLGLGLIWVVALGPGDIFAAPIVHLANFLGAVLFLIETVRVMPTGSRLDGLFRVYPAD